ncbi:MAG: nitrogen regulation protein NR(II) [Succinivibrio sp.]
MTDKQKANLLESIATAVFLTDRQFNIVYANTAAEQLCGVSRSRLKYLRLTDFIDPSETSLLQTIAGTDFTDSFQGFSAAGIELSPYPGKSTKADLTVFNYSSESYPNGLLVEIHTISHQEKLINQVQQNFQYTAARDLIRSLAHEIKNPLGGIRGAAQLVEMTYGKVDGIKDYTKVIIEQTDRLKVLVNNLLGPQKPNPLEKENVHYLIEKVLSLVSMGEDSKNIKITRDYDPSLPELNLDVNSIEQVLLNIVNNAVQALNDSHTENPVITIKTRASIRTIVREKKYPTAIIISISNNGPEIPEHIKQTVFFPMVTTKAHGNGLGLSIALNIVERHEGTIECLSDAHRTEFRIILPIKSRIQGER